MLYLLLRHFESFLDAHGWYRLFGVLDFVEFRALAAAGLSFLLVLALGPMTIRWLRRMKIGDAGLTDAGQLAAHAAGKANVPTMGGILIVGAMLASVLLLADLSVPYVGIGILVIVCYAGLGVSDDWLKLTASRRGTGSRQGLHAWEKLVFQLGISALVAWSCYVQNDQPLTHVLNLPFQRSYDPRTGAAEVGLIILTAPVFVLISTLFITGLSNAVNITDGMDGLAGGISGVVAVGLFVLALIAGTESFASHLLVPHVERSAELAVIAGAMGGACAGFLWWNCYPASVFMGDTGSLALGATIGYIAIVIRQEILVVLMGAIFIAEAGSVVLQVGYFKATRSQSGTGKRLFKCAPFHHHLHLSLWTEQQIVVRFWIITILGLVVALASLKIR
ncbi:MAG: phospho-N-acetylmuramoyl-pentapeptide-transferase [Planctomycetota bacterium]|mgnify:CR=1 FL=1